ncbi:TPA: DUF551 domain-containing protein [Klebsiella pneumoniae]|uniref:DUF551 domain-containing protein n=1 Tax=Klebsiella pneumoniae TaxID=573 RepID=UPI0026581F03|nr:DUF551 domain-containing protein [Klebsiella pneumoniae]WKI11635.1 DUF551 domain-containing protein [Klebsiella pneumoniae]HBW4479508.1 DUF551 domain-containing protein [Klebsiella pneumoniae]HBW4512990.1 DUF551 domain-containing protein [Klebsiella pneumoniae]HBW4518494.1 DUF551 domain-containing protein [Klebsiella pneumoniae]HBW4563548.1 DUF551 domain-containing protein [Klebsiella pneumoniae]
MINRNKLEHILEYAKQQRYIGQSCKVPPEDMVEIMERLLSACNSPAIPDGWIKCSERMPEAIGEYLVAYKLMNHWIYQKVITFAHLSEYTNEMGWNSNLEITHWMLPPSAPQGVKP